MKKNLILTAAIFAAAISSGQAQTSDAEADAIVNLLGVQKKEAMSRLVEVSSKDSAAFWKIYDEYQQVNKATGKERINLYEKTALAYKNMTPEVADSLSDKYFTNRFEQEKTLEAYYKKIKAATNAVVAFQFYQAEVFMLTQIRASIMEQVPTYGEFQHARHKH